MANANSADPDQKEQSDQDLHCLPFHLEFCEINPQNAILGQKSMEKKVFETL